MTSRFFAVRDLGYLIYPLPWLLRLGNIYKHVGLKFFSVSWHSKWGKSIWFEIVFQWKQTWLQCTTLSNFICELANHASSCKFHNIRFSIAENSTTLPYFPIPHITSVHNCLEFSQRPLVFTSGYANTENVYRKRRHETLFSSVKAQASIPLVEEVELLGVTVNDKLKFESQIKIICREVSQQITVLKRTKKLLPLKLWETLYRAFIAPHFNWCAKSWHFCSNRLTGKLEKLNEHELCFVYQDKISTYETLVVKNGCSTLANQRLAKMLNTVFEAIKNWNVPTSISELLTVRNSNYNLRGDAILKLPKVK